MQNDSINHFITKSFRDKFSNLKNFNYFNQFVKNYENTSRKYIKL